LFEGNAVSKGGFPCVGMSARARQRDCSPRSGGMFVAHRFAFMDGLRGVGAVQVMLCHLLARLGFVSPFGLELVIVDGSLAVFIFFFVSGYVLTTSYERSTASTWELVRARMVRLFVPTMAAGLFCIAVWGALQLISPQNVASLPAGGMSARQLLAALADAFFVTPFLGQTSSSLFIGLPYIGDIVRNSTPASFVLWTINIEFLGSMVVLCLCRAGRGGTWLAALGVILLLRSLLLPFVVGFLLRRIELPKFRFSLIVFAVLFSAGVWLSILASNHEHLAFARKIAGLKYIVPAQSAFSVQKCAAALMIFVGVLLCWNVRAVLSSRPARWLGMISFPLYLAHESLVAVFSAVLAAAGSSAVAIVVFAVLLAPALWLFSVIDAAAVRWSRHGRSNSSGAEIADGMVAVPAAVR